MRKYEDLIMEALKGDTPKAKYDTFMQIEKSLTVIGELEICEVSEEDHMCDANRIAIRASKLLQ